MGRRLLSAWSSSFELDTGLLEVRRELAACTFISWSIAVLFGPPAALLAFPELLPSCRAVMSVIAISLAAIDGVGSVPGGEKHQLVG